jgi:hypothetical protein
MGTRTTEGKRVLKKSTKREFKYLSNLEKTRP